MFTAVSKADFFHLCLLLCRLSFVHVPDSKQCHTSSGGGLTSSSCPTVNQDFIQTRTAWSISGVHNSVRGQRLNLQARWGAQAPCRETAQQKWWNYQVTFIRITRSKRNMLQNRHFDKPGCPDTVASVPWSALSNMDLEIYITLLLSFLYSNWLMVSVSI